jgi:hypothetical protein
MKNAVAALLLIASCTGAVAQIGTVDGGEIVNSTNLGYLGSNHLPDSFLKSKNKVITYKDVEGTPYINNNSGANNNLPIGKVYDKDFKYISTAFIRYNAYTDNMEVSLMSDGVDYYLLKKQPDFFYVVLNKKRYRAYNYIDDKVDKTGYFIIVSEDDKEHGVLLKKEKILFKKASQANNSFVTSTPPSFIKTKDTYYIKLGNQVNKVPKKKKEFFSMFKDKSFQIKTFASKNKLKINKEESLLRIVKYYNEL